MVTFELSQSQEELTSHSGLALVGAALRRMQFCEGIADVRLPGAKAEPTIAHSDVLKSYTGLLCQGKSDYEAIEPFRAGDDFFPSVGLSVCWLSTSRFYPHARPSASAWINWGLSASISSRP